MTSKVKELYDIVMMSFEGNLSFTTKGNYPVLAPETINIDVLDGVTRFVGESYEETIKWNDLSDNDVDFLEDIYELEN